MNYELLICVPATQPCERLYFETIAAVDRSTTARHVHTVARYAVQERVGEGGEAGGEGGKVIFSSKDATSTKSYKNLVHLDTSLCDVCAWIYS